MNAMKACKDKIISVRLEHGSFKDLMKRRRPGESRSTFLRRLVDEYMQMTGDERDDRSSEEIR